MSLLLGKLSVSAGRFWNGSQSKSLYSTSVKTTDFFRSCWVVAVSAAAYWLTSEAQSLIGSEIDTGVDNPYLPAGIRLIAAAVFGLAGCVGVFLGSLLEAPNIFPGAGWLPALLLSAAGAFVPLLALQIVRWRFGIGEQLLELSFRGLLALVCLQSVLSPVVHQSLFYVTGVATPSAYNLAAMIVGDVVGCMLVVLLVALVWGLVRRR